MRRAPFQETTGKLRNLGHCVSAIFLFTRNYIHANLLEGPGEVAQFTELSDENGNKGDDAADCIVHVDLFQVDLCVCRGESFGLLEVDYREEGCQDTEDYALGDQEV